MIYNSVNFFWIFKDVINKHGFDDIGKNGYSRPSENIGILEYHTQYYVHDVTNRILSCDSNYIVNVVIWTKFGNSNTSIREVIVTWI